METGRTDESDEAEGVAHSCDDLSEFVQIVCVVFELAQLLYLPVQMLGSLIRVEAGIILLITVFLEPFAVSGHQILDIVHEEELGKGRNFAK